MLKPKTDNFLKDLALQQQSTDLEIARDLMNLVVEARPGGKFPQKKFFDGRMVTKYLENCTLRLEFELYYLVTAVSKYIIPFYSGKVVNKIYLARS